MPVDGCAGVSNTLLDIPGFPLLCIQGFSYCPMGGNTTRLSVVEVQPLDQRIRELCSKAVTAKDSEVEAILSELQAALREHTQFVRQMTAQMQNRGSKKPSQAA